MKWIMDLLFGNITRILITMAVVAALGFVGVFKYTQVRLHQTEEALAATRSVLATRESELELARAATREAEYTHRVESETRADVSTAQEEIANAQSASTFYAAWVAGINSVRDDGTASA